MFKADNQSPIPVMNPHNANQPIQNILNMFVFLLKMYN